MFTEGTRIRFTYTRATSTNGKRAGDVSVRQGVIVQGEQISTKSGRAFIRVDCGDTHNGEPMPKSFQTDSMSNVVVL